MKVKEDIQVTRFWTYQGDKIGIQTEDLQLAQIIKALPYETSHRMWDGKKWVVDLSAGGDLALRFVQNGYPDLGYVIQTKCHSDPLLAQVYQYIHHTPAGIAPSEIESVFGMDGYHCMDKLIEDGRICMLTYGKYQSFANVEAEPQYLRIKK